MESVPSGNQWLTEMQVLEQLKKFIKKRIIETKTSINKTEGIEHKLNWGKLLAYEVMLDEIEHKLGHGLFD